jgi:type III secretory pathway component EscV
VFPILIFAAIAIPLLVIAFLAMRRTRTAGEHPAGETAADRQRTEDEFEEAERYQTEWREEHHSEVRDELLP